MVTDFKNKKKRNPSKQIFLVLGGIVISIFFVLLIIESIGLHQKKIELAKQVDNLESKILDIKNKNEELKQGFARGDNEEYIEKVAREELDLQKPGEKVFSFIVPASKEQEKNIISKNVLDPLIKYLPTVISTFWLKISKSFAAYRPR